MAVDFTGHVLRAPRSAPGNDPGTSPPDNGVVRDVLLPPGLARTAAMPDIVDLAGDQYRAAVLDAPGTTPHEYLVWAANSSQLALVDDPTWWVADGSGRIPVGELVVQHLTPGLHAADGTLKVIVTDDGGREIGVVTHLIVARGDKTYDDEGWVDVDAPASGRKGPTPYEVVVPTATDQTNGVVTLTDDNIFTAPGSNPRALVPGTLASNLGDGLSLGRGDFVAGVRYTVSSIKFWWTRNDRYETRFGWNAPLQRWMPFKGSAPVNLGTLQFDTKYQLSPKIRSLPVEATLDGDASVADQYAVIRLGSSAGALSLPVGVNDADGFDGIIVVPDAEIGKGYVFAGTVHAGVVGQTNGTLEWNPLFVDKHAGKVIWYVYRGFSEEADGILGDLITSGTDPLFLAPVPGPTDHPFIRINNRMPLAVTLVDLEADLAAVALIEGTCAVALSTGRLQVSQADINKSDPEKLATFDKHFLGAKLIYGGVALNNIPQPTKAPVVLVRGDEMSTVIDPVAPMYLRSSRMWPEDMVGDATLDPFRGLGVSGVLSLPDGTGAVPDPEGVAPGGFDVPVRPGGDTLPPVGGGAAPQTLGLVRRVQDGISDAILFSKEGAVTRLTVINRLTDAPSIPAQVKGGTAVIVREGTALPSTDLYSSVVLSRADRKKFKGHKVYFLQAALTPSTYTTRAVLWSKSRLVFRFDTLDVLYFGSSGVAHDWHASSLAVQDFYTATEVAASIQARIDSQGGSVSCTAVGDRVRLAAGSEAAGWLEIGWGDPKDLSGAAALGFLPGWRVDGGKPNWLSDSGTSLGLSRSLLNLDRSTPTADYRATSRLEDVVLSESIPQAPFVFFDFPPIEDIAGFDEGVFFNMQTVQLQGDDLQIIDKRLDHFDEIQHRFFEGKFSWLEGAQSSNPVQVRTTNINLGRSNVVPETMLGAPGIGGGFLTAENAGRYVMQKQGDDYLLPQEGGPGAAQLITRYGSRSVFGAQGTFAAVGTTFTDLSTDFLADSTDPDIDPATGQQKVDGSGSLIWLPVAQVGYRLKMASGTAPGSYIVTAVTDGQHLEVAPAFISISDRPTPWELFEGIPDSLFDPAVVADVVYKPFDHIEDEPFKVRTLTPLGVVATTDFTAVLEDANASGRIISLRFGGVAPTPAVEASLSPVAITSSGVLANNVLVLPDVPHVDEAAFRLQVGSDVMLPGAGLLAVAAFSNNPVEAEYLTADWDDGLGTIHPKGELKFSSGTLTALESSATLLVEELRSSADLVSGQAEYDPKTGEVRISDADAATHAGTMLYLVEEMVTKDRLDVSVAPMSGAVAFVKPLNRGVLVEMVYWLADNEGRRVGGVADTITEFLPLFVRREAPVRVSDRVFQFDSVGDHVIDDRIDPTVYLGPMQQNFGVTDFTVTKKIGTGFEVTFNRDIPAWVTPEGSYATFDALGGERSYSTSQRPVYRPPFFVKAGRDNFGLRGNRMAEFEPGQMLRLGTYCFYITKLRYFPDSDLTRCDIYPSTVVEIGTRSPGNDVLAVITDKPITTETTDPDGVVVATTAAAGFMQEIPVGTFPFEPVNAKQNSITFLGNLKQFAVAGHILDVDGTPYTITQAKLSEDGTRTKITLSSPFWGSVDPSGTHVIKLSYRPIYPPQARTFLGVGPLVESEGVELTLYGETEAGAELPGRQLARGTEFEVDSEAGVIELLAPLQESLGAGQKLVFSYTQLRAMEPFFNGGSVVFPRWAAIFKYNTIPNEDNGIVGGRLTATYTFDNPDSFYYRALPLKSYLAEAVKQALDELTQGTAGGGPRLSVAGGSDNWQQGNLGLLAQRRDLVDKDRAARRLLGFYNDAIVSFEQVDECVTGKFIGDRDGKFRFWVGFGRDYAPPGYEDPITGVLNATNVWSQVFNEADPTRDITFVQGVDLLVNPALCTMVDLRLVGEPLGPDLLATMVTRQRALIRNDVDDVLLVGAQAPKVVQTTTYPYLTVEIGGIFRRMGATHNMSRLFPTRARVLFTLLPGLGADITGSGDVGKYAFKWTNPNTGAVESTHRQAIGQVRNPVLGDISGISDKLLRPRLARARVWGYFPDGIPATAFGGAIEKPCIVVSMIPLSEIPVDPTTGFPHAERFLSEDPNGDTPDALAGHPELSLPGFQVSDKISWGQPDGGIYEAVFPEEVDVFGTPLWTGIYVDEVLHGCVLTLKDRNDNEIVDPGQVMVANAPNSGVPAHTFGIDRGDTVFVIPPDVENPFADTEGQPTIADLQTAAALSPAYRNGFDISVNADGQVLDLSLPSWTDPALFPMKELLGQKTPLPLGHIEGDVDFANVAQVPLVIPALDGLPTDDAGDTQFPFLKTTNTELDRFDEITGVLGPVMATDPVDGGIYPDEILFSNGEVVGLAVLIAGTDYKEPATLMTPTKTDIAAGVGVAPARPGDFVIAEVTGGGPAWQGLFTIGALRNVNTGGADWSWIEPPRFASQVSKGTAIRYELDNYFVHTTPGVYPALPQAADPGGVKLFEDIAAGDTIISFRDIVFVLNDGDTVGVGNLNTIIAADADNVVTIKVIGRPDDTAVNDPSGAGNFGGADKDGKPILTIEIRSGFARVTDFLSAPGAWVAHTGVTFGVFDAANIGGETPPAGIDIEGHQHIIITGWTEIPFAGGAASPLEWFLPHTIDAGVSYVCEYGWEVAVDVHTSGTGESTSAYIDSDRLTFHEVVDLRASTPRDFLHINGVGSNYTYETTLWIREVFNDALAAPAFSADHDIGPGPLSMVSRVATVAPGTSIQGDWNDAGGVPGDEEGNIRVMGFEGGVTPITASNIVASVVASQTTDQGGTDILTGNGTASLNRIEAITPGTGGIDNVEKGDVVYIDRSDDTLPNSATDKAGTYITRYAVDPDAGKDYKRARRTTTLGSGGGFVTTVFPRVISIDVGAQQLVVDDDSVLPASGKVFILVRPGDLDSLVAAEHQQSIFSVEYTAKAANVLTLEAANTWRWADDSIVVAPGTEITTALVTGRRLSWHDNPFPVVGAGASNPGIMALSISIRGVSLPDDSSVVGSHTVGGGVDDARYGFHDLRYQRGTATTTVGIANLVAGGGPVAGEVGVAPKTPHANETFDPTNAVAVYDDVPGTLHIHVDSTQGNLLYDTQGHVAGTDGMSTLLPGTVVDTFNGTDSFYALGGIFVEPSTPHGLLALSGAAAPPARVVDATRAMAAAADVGMLNPTVEEAVHFEVRRVRRWHGAQNGVNDAFKPLRFAYEVRRGVVTAFSRNEQQVGTLTALDFEMNWNVGTPFPRVPDVWSDNDSILHTGTNLGLFNDENVNINPGDIVRILDDAGVVIGDGVVQEVVDGQDIKLAAPGIPELTAGSLAGRRFEVYLRQAPVPHEQSNEELLDLITDKLVHETVADHSNADPSNWVGGYVDSSDGTGTWDTVSNKLKDDAPPGVSFVVLGVRVGDIVLIDPMGLLPVVDESGARPLGDTSVPTRTTTGGPNPYVAGQVSSLDDNRGYYRITKVSAFELELDPVTTFAGTLGADVLMAEARTDLVYSIYPTVNSSVLSTDAAEGQNDLRPTRRAENIGGWTFTKQGTPLHDKHSMRPFSYRIIRPNSVFDTELVDTVLMMRERMLSLIEMFRGAMQGDKGGFYYDWQEDEHVLDLGDATDPTSGLGLFPNRLITTLVGEMGVSPFANTSDCLSLLDRRAWVGDSRLDSLKPDPNNAFAMVPTTLAPLVAFPDDGGPYTAYTDLTDGGAEIRPSLLDHLGQILDVRDRLRAIRYTWLAYRTHRFIGTLSRIEAFDAEFPVKLAERERALLLEASSDKAQE